MGWSTLPGRSNRGHRLTGRCARFRSDWRRIWGWRRSSAGSSPKLWRASDTIRTRSRSRRRVPRSLRRPDCASRSWCVQTACRLRCHRTVSSAVHRLWCRSRTSCEYWGISHWSLLHSLLENTTAIGQPEKNKSINQSINQAVNIFQVKGFDFSARHWKTRKSSH